MTDPTGVRVQWGAVISVLLGMVACAFSVSILTMRCLVVFRDAGLMIAVFVCNKR